MQTKTPLIVPANVTRRQFLTRTTMAVGAASLAFPYVGRVLGANDRINIACIGVGGKGDSDSSNAATCGGNIVAICDVDKGTLAGKAKQFEKFKDLKQFQDYRKMFDSMSKDIDAVTVSTPDHHHGIAAILAAQLGKHIYCQKPLVQTVAEARLLRRLVLDKKLASQMGNQGSAENGLRRAVEVIQAGVIGKPREIHVWSDRPIWPQGYDRPPGSDPVPANLDWDVWLGPAQERPYKKDCYHSFVWRGWFEFGTGALGDMACHQLNMPFRACKLGYPNVVEYEIGSRFYPETYPKTSRIRFEFPEREGLPPLKLWWYDGNPGDPLKPLRPSPELTREMMDIPELKGNFPSSGALIVGEKGKFFSPDTNCSDFYIIQNDADKYVHNTKDEACKAVPQTIERAPAPGGELGHVNEWLRMMKDPSKPAYSNFEIAGYLTEVILLGCVALRVGEGRRMEWDGPNMRSPNLAEAAQYVKRSYRPGWEVKV